MVEKAAYSTYQMWTGELHFTFVKTINCTLHENNEIYGNLKRQTSFPLPLLYS